MDKLFFKSKIFWTSCLGFLAVIASGAFGWEVGPELITGIMAFLAILFRWNYTGDSKLKIK